MGGDIDTGAHLASRIHQYGFLEEDAAGTPLSLINYCDRNLTSCNLDVHYKNFQNDILNFRHLLEKLQDALRSAQQRYIDRGRTLGIRTYAPLSEDFEKERKIFVGDFTETLRACNTLLEENKRIRLKYSDAIENLSWHLAQQEQRSVDLRSRLRLHTEKIRFAIDRLSIDLLTDRDSNVENLLAVAERNVQVSNAILPELHRQLLLRGSIGAANSGNVHTVNSVIAQKFQGYLLANAPLGTEMGLPLRHGFDALLTSLLESTKGSDQTPEKYLLFLKTRWLLDRVQESAEYQATYPCLYYKRAVNQIEQAILARVHQPGELIAYDFGVLLNLPDFLFRIWPSATVPPAVQHISSHQLMARANEEKLVCLKLASDNLADPDIVTVFKSSDKSFRIVVRTATDPTIGAKSLIPQTVYSAEDRLIPRYALPTIAEPSPEIAIFSRGEEALYRFNTFQDLYKLQTALTGHDVSHDQADIQCQFSDEVFFLDCVGRIQLWQEPIILSPATEDSDLHQRRSLRTQNSFVEGTHSRRDSVLPSASVAPTNTVSWTTGGWEAENIKLPTIVIFTQLAEKNRKSRFAIISIPLETGVYLDASECGCHRDYTTCSKLVLTKEKKRSLRVRVLYADNDASGQPNPNTFDLFPFRLPRHPTYHNLMSKQTEYLVLKFRSLPAKQAFHRELDLRFRVRDKQITDQRNFTNRIRHRQERPQGRQRVMSSNDSYRPSFSVYSNETSLAPIIDVPDTGPALGAALSNGTYSTSSPLEANTSGLGPAVIYTPRSLGSRRTAPSDCTSLDGHILAANGVHRIDQHLVGERTPVLTPETASSTYSAIGTIPRSQQSAESNGIDSHVANALQNHREYYGVPEGRVVTGLARSPSSLAPEWYNPGLLNDKSYEAHDYAEILLENRSQNFVTPQVSIPVGLNIQGGIHPATISQVPRAQSTNAPEWYSPDSFTPYRNQIRQNQERPAQRQLAPILDERSGIQIESTMSRSKTGRRRGGWKFWQK